MRSWEEEKQLGIYKRHELKVLNISLILYVCLGTFLFHSLGEFEEPIELLKKQNDATKKEERINLKELRLKSVNRMWNITNQLNILYESNWTLLVLDELVEFEKSFLKALSSVNHQYTNFDENNDIEDVDNDDDSDKSKNEKEKSKKRRRIRSLQRSLIHSLATITTIGSPLQVESLRTQTGKLLTLFYGSLGIPLFIYTLSRSGKKLAHSSLNFFLILRHYFFALPLHYLCCSCNLQLCFTWLFCCCCCSQLFTCCFCQTNETKKKNKKTKTTNCCCCCDTQDAPKLRLHKGNTLHRPPPIDGTTTPMIQHHPANLKQATSAINQYYRGQQCTGTAQQQHKSVRFEGGQQQGRLINFLQNKDLNQDDNCSIESYKTENLFSSGLFITSLSILAIYLSTGAYFYSKSTQNTSLIDGLFICYEMISGSKLPDALILAKIKKNNLDPSNLYSNLLINNSSTQNNLLNSAAPHSSTKFNHTNIESFIWNLVYMIVGLHLVSMCANFAHLWISGKKFSELLIQQTVPATNSLRGDDVDEFDNSSGFRDTFKTMLNAIELTGEINGDSINQIKTDQHFHQQQPMQTISSSLTSVNNNNNTNLIQQHPSQVDLAELFVVDHQDSPATIHAQQQLYAQNQQPQTSDVSIASTDRSTDRASLCLHHQAQLPVSSTSEASLYQQHHHHLHHHHQPIYGQQQQQQILHAHLCLPSMSVGCNQQQRLESTGEEDDDDDDNEMVQHMLKSCINGTGHQKSSSIQLSHSNGQISSLAAQNGLDQNQNSNTLSRLYSSNDCNNNELDSSLTTNSNTISSVGSRTIKVPQRMHHHTHAIGFVLNQQQTLGNNTTHDNINNNTLERL